MTRPSFACGLVAVTCAVLAACRVTGAFECQTNDQCRTRDASGTCQPTGWCSFTDATCLTGQRYDDTAGDGLAGQCFVVAVDAGTDGLVDSGFDPATCPAMYNRTLPSQPLSRYRLTQSTALSFAQHVARCVQDDPATSHAIVIGSLAELDELVMFLGGGQPVQIYVGAIQNPAATTVGGGWIAFDDTPVPAMFWGLAQPDDADSDEGDHAEQVGTYLPSDRRLHDGIAATAGPSSAVCECDGKPMGQQASVFVMTP